LLRPPASLWSEGGAPLTRAPLPRTAAELISLQPDVIVTSGPWTLVLKDATTTIPIVMAVGGDAAADGLVASLARPGGNITGSTFFGPETLRQAPGDAQSCYASSRPLSAAIIRPVTAGVGRLGDCAW
jgi:ABC transporter substrate binding protein